MFIKTISLANFRNFEKFKYEFEKPITLVIGPNGSGKSNFLESIYLLATTRSSRAKKDTELISWGKDFARVEAKISNLDWDSDLVRNNQQSVINNLTILIQKSQKKLKINGKVKSTFDFLGNFFAVLFSPRDLNLLIGPPAGRRRFLNQLTLLLDKNFLKILVSYHKALRQRNKLLSNKAPVFEFEYWDKILAENGAKIIFFRSKIIAQLNQILAKDGLCLIYLPSPRAIGQLGSLAVGQSEAIVKVFEEKLAKLHEKERELGFTIIGPQRDEWRLGKQITDNRLPLTDLGVFGSRGEQRIAVVALKLAQIELLKKATNFSPVLLLDDVFSELDEQNQAKLLHNLESQQTIITTTHKKNLPSNLLSSQVLNLG